MTAATLGAGNVDIVLDGETVTLKPTLRAAQTISRQSGGILGAIQAVGKFDLDVLTNVIGLGLNLTKPSEMKDLGEKVYASGMTDLVAPVTMFLSHLANGGRAIPNDGGEGADRPR